jgi:hypothetical protein
MAETMEGVVTATEPKTENVEQKAIAGKSTTSAAHHAFYLEMPL